MRKAFEIMILSAGLASVGGVAHAGIPVPAPLIGAGLPGLAVLAVAGGGYLAVRAFRKRR